MKRQEPVRVIMVDDNTWVPQSLKLFLSINDDLKVVAVAGGGEEALSLYARIRPDAITLKMRWH